MSRFQTKQQDDDGLQDNVVNIYRCSKVVKGGRRFSFSALVVVGDGQGKVGVGYGKANEVPPAVEKGKKIARRNMEPVPLEGSTIPHRVEGRFGSSRVVLVPASPGTGVIAGASVRAVLELAGVSDVLTKAYGSTSPKNLVKATLEGLRQLRTREKIQALRGVALPHDEKRDQRIRAAAKRAEQQAARQLAVAAQMQAKPTGAPAKARPAAPEQTKAEPAAVVVTETAQPSTPAPAQEAQKSAVERPADATAANDAEGTSVVKDEDSADKG